MIKSNIVFVILRVILGAMFIFAGATKIGDPAAFANDIDNYRMLPYVLVSLMAIILPWVEIIAGLLLVTGKLLHGASFTLIVLNVVFIIAISSALARGLDINCGCFSMEGTSSQVGVVRLFEDVIYLSMAVVIYLRAMRE